LKTATQLVTLSRDHPEYQNLTSHAGEFGWNYCRFLLLEKIDDIIDDACFFVLAPFIEQRYVTGKAALPKYPATLRIRMDMEARALLKKSKRAATLPAWMP